MLLPVPPQYRGPRRRRRPSPEPAPPPATVDVVSVGMDHGSEFDWYFVWQFDGPLPASLTLDDVRGLTVGNVAPASIEDRGDDWLMVRCHAEEGVGATWLVAAGGSPVFVPGQTGVVQEI